MKKIISSICLAAATITATLAQTTPQLSAQQMRVLLKERGFAYATNKAEADKIYINKIAHGSAATQSKLASLLTTGPEQDCNSAIAVCQNSYSQAQSYTGKGSIDELGANGACLTGGESNSVWYRFTANNAGVVDFDITPNDLVDDYDWAIYDLTGKNCADITSGSITPIRCNYSSTNGITGLDASAANNSEPAGGSNQSKTINAVAGQSFVLLINNFSNSQNGYNINFTGTAQIFDNTAPIFSSLVSACGATTLQVNFNEPVLCSTISLTDFVITGQNGVTYTVTAANGVNCGGSTSQVLLTVNPALPANLTDSIFVKIVTGTDGNTLTDQCGNSILNNSSKGFVNSPATSNAPLIVSPNDSICSGGQVTLTAPPALSYAWSNGAITQTIQVYVSVNTTYNVTMPNGTCGASVGTVQIVTVNGPVIGFTIANDTVCLGQLLVINNTSKANTCSGNGTKLCDPPGILNVGCNFASCTTTNATAWSTTLINSTWSFGDGGVGGYSTSTMPVSHTYADTGLYTITYNIDVPASGGGFFGGSTSSCKSELTKQVHVIAQPNASWNTPGVVCINAGDVKLKDLLTGDTTGTFTCTTCPVGALVGGVFHPDSIHGLLPKSFPITYTAVNSICNDSKINTLVVNGRDSADFMLPTTICQSAHTINLDSLVNGTTGGKWKIVTTPTINGKIDTLMGNSYLNLDSTVFVPTFDTATVTIRYIVGNPLSLCGVDTAIKKILILRTPTPNFTTPTVCQTSNGLFLNPLALAPGLTAATSVWVRSGLVKQIPANSGNYYLLDSAISGPIAVKHITINTVGTFTCRDSIVKNINVNVTPKIPLTGATIANATCIKIDGSITNVKALPAFGTPYTYQWYAGKDTTAPATIIVGATDDSLLVRPVGYYTINVMNGACRAKQTFQIKQVRVPVVTGAPFYFDKLCTIGTGSIVKNNLQIINAPIKLTVIDSATNMDLTGFPKTNLSTIDTLIAGGLIPNTYWVLVTDASTCIDTFKIVIKATTTNALATLGTTTPAICTATNGGITGVSIKHLPVSQANITWTNTTTGIVASTALNPNNLPKGTYLLNVTDKYGCVDTLTRKVGQVFDSVFVFKGNTAPSKCTANNGSVTLVDIKNDPLTSAQWTNAAGQNVGTSNNLNLLNQAPGTYTLNVVDAFGCTSTLSKIITNVFDSVFVNKGNSLPAKCTSATGSILGVSTTNSLGTTQWTNALGQNVGTANSLSLSPIAAGTYTLNVTDAFGCVGTLTKTVGTTLLQVYTTQGAATYTICGKATGDVTGIKVVNTPSNSIWTNVATGTKYTNTPTGFDQAGLQNVNAGTYEVVTTDNFGCKDSITFIIADSTYANASFTPSTTKGDEALLVNFANTTVTHTGNIYNWDFGDGNDTSSFNASHTYPTHNDYLVVLTVKDKFGCVDTQSVLINVYETFDPKVPNIFTPNGDSHNDVFKVFGKGIKMVDYLVYDRWGKKVYEASNLTGWDGNGHHDGTYYYVIKVAATDNVKTKELKGYLQLLK
jgi:gliding motility-associated-like protein